MVEALSNTGAAAVPAVPAPILVTDTASFKAAINQVDSATAGAYVIQLANAINETGTLDAINLQSGVTLTIDGAGYMLDGGNQYRGLFAYAGAITIQNLSINDMLAQGGAAGYGAAGGGAGLGGGLFVAGSNPGLASGASVVLSNVNFSHDQAVGGFGSTGLFGGGSPTSSGGGGGGLGGNGGDYNFSSGGGGGIGAAAGMAGIVPGAASGGSSSPFFNAPSTPGGVNGGGGGGGGSGDFPTAGGGGGIGGASGTSYLPENNSAGGAGGFGGGGGGGGGPSGAIGLGGNGGFGGGGGGGLNGGNGGFGGGGAVSIFFDGRAGGFGAGSAMKYRVGNDSKDLSTSRLAGGGGLGAGGAIFVQAGGSLTIQGGTVDGAGSATGGAAQALPGEVNPAALNGQGLGAAIFLQGNQALNLAAAAGQTTTVANVIADQTGSGGTGADAGDGSLVVSGPGIVKLSAANTYAGGTTLGSGTLELTSPTAAGTGNLQFTAPGATLQLDPGAFANGVFSNLVGGFIGDNIDLPGLRYSPTASTTLDHQGMLTVTSEGSQDQLTVGSQNDPFLAFQTVADGSGGTMVEEVGGPTLIATPGFVLPGSYYLKLSEDAYLGDAQFTVAVDGVQTGGVQTVRALHNVASGSFILDGRYGSGPHTVTLTFINDAYGGSPSLDRNLYVDAIGSLDANGLPTGTATLYGTELYANGALTFSVGAPVPTGPTTVGSGPDSFALNISEDAYLGDARFGITVDGVPIGPVQTATALHGSGQTQVFTVQGNFGFGPHVVGVDFLNDLYGGTPSTDRNLYVDGAQSGSQTYGGLALYAGGTQYLTVQIQPPTSVTLGSGPDVIELNVSEDAYNSGGQTDAQFTISVDGVQIGDVQTAYAARSQGKTEAFLVQGAFGAGSHVVSVDFLNDAYGGSLALDRNLYVDSIIAGGQLYGGITLQSGGPQSETLQTPADVTLGSGPSALNFSLSEDALAGVDAQFTLSLGGVQFGGVQTVTASHAAGADQLFTILGNFPLNTYEPVTLNFLNGGGGRNLYVDKLTRVVPLGFYTSVSSSPSELTASGPVSLPFRQSYPRGGPTTVGTGPDSVTIDVSAAQTLISQNPSSGVPFIRPVVKVG